MSLNPEDRMHRDFTKASLTDNMKQIQVQFGLSDKAACLMDAYGVGSVLQFMVEVRKEIVLEDINLFCRELAEYISELESIIADGRNV